MVTKPKRTVIEDLELKIANTSDIELKSMLQAKLNLIKSNETVNK